MTQLDIHTIAKKVLDDLDTLRTQIDPRKLGVLDLYNALCHEIHQHELAEQQAAEEREEQESKAGLHMYGFDDDETAGVESER